MLRCADQIGFAERQTVLHYQRNSEYRGHHIGRAVQARSIDSLTIDYTEAPTAS